MRYKLSLTKLRGSSFESQAFWLGCSMIVVSVLLIFISRASAQSDPVSSAANQAWNYGLGVVLSILMAVFLGRILMYVLQQNEKREERLSGLIEIHINGVGRKLSEHHEVSISAIASINEANKRQREEHEAMLRESKAQNEILQKISDKLGDISCAKG